jgi:hypothetical protein
VPNSGNHTKKLQNSFCFVGVGHGQQFRRAFACQTYGGACTQIKEYGQGQGPNVVLRQTEQFGLLPGAKAWIFKKLSNTI